LIEQLHRRRSGRAEDIVGGADIEMKFAAIVFVADVAVKAANFGGGMIPITIVVDRFQRAIDGVIANLFSPLQRRLEAAVRPAHDVDRRPLKVESVLHLHAKGAAQRIQPEGGIVADDVDRAHGRGWDQVPVDGVAEGLVDAHAVLVDGQALRRARNGRSVKAAKFHVGLKGIAGHFADSDAWRLLGQGLHEAWRSRALDLLGAHGGDAGRNFIDVDANSGKWRRREHVDGRQSDGARRTRRGERRCFLRAGSPRAKSDAH
jgi:hypothetical protein